jgi:general secretion pathway protein G
MIVGFVSVNVFSNLDKANVKSATNQMIGFESALDLYYLDNGMYPTTEQGLEALINEPSSGPKPHSYAPGGYLRGSKIPLDPWNTPYQYESDGSSYKIMSFGKDKKEGGTGYGKDIVVQTRE